MAALFAVLALAHGLTVAIAIAREPVVTEKPARIVFEKKGKKAKIPRKARVPANR